MDVGLPRKWDSLSCSMRCCKTYRSGSRKKMDIVGLGGSLHDFSACIARDGRIMVAIEAERLTRRKHGVDKQALQTAIEARQLWKLQAQGPEKVLEQCIEYCLGAQRLR